MTHETIWIVKGEKELGSAGVAFRDRLDAEGTAKAYGETYANLGPFRVLSYTLTALVDVPADAWAEDTRP